MQWVAGYSDNTEFPQYNADGSENRYADIDRARLVTFGLFKGMRPVLVLHLEPGQRLIYRRRVERTVAKAETEVFLVGWQQTIQGQNVQSISYVFPDGSVHVAGRWRENHPWFYAVESIPVEEAETVCV